MDTASWAERFANRKQGLRRFRKQQGTIVERSNAFWVRFYRDGGDGTRIKVTEKLCDKTKEFPSADCHAVTVLRDVRMAQVNAEHHKELSAPTPLPQAPPLTMGAFWVTTYQPWVLANRRWSTHRGYKIIWEQYLQDELETKALSEYRTVDGSRLLTGLASRLNRNSLAHVRSLMSGIFSHATSLGLIDRNPIRDVKVLARVRPPKPRVKYTPEETVDVLNALTEPEAKLFFAFCAVLAMRPEETAATRWENIDIKAGVLKVREAAPYGKLGELKTEQSIRDLHFGEDVRGFIEAWHNAMGKPTTGFLFTYNGVDPVNSNNFSRDRIAAQAKKACARWCGLYSGRHGAAKTLYNQDGDLRAAYQSLGNSLEVVMATYVEPDTATGKVSSLKMQAALSKGLNKKEKL